MLGMKAVLSPPVSASASPPALASPALAATSVAPSIALLQGHSLTSLAHRDIEALILTGELAPGSKLNEAELAARLGVSRGPVREALRSLEESGLVRQEKNRGAFVRDIALDEALEIFDLRAVLDEAVARQLAATITAPQLKTLRAQVDQLERLARAGDTGGYHLLNLAFHDQMVEFTGNRKLIAVYRRLVNELSLFRRRNLADAEHLPVSAAEHRAIVRAIASGDAALAGDTLRAHVMRSRERTLRNHPAPPAASPGKPRHA